MVELPQTINLSNWINVNETDLSNQTTATFYTTEQIILTLSTELRLGKLGVITRKNITTDKNGFTKDVTLLRTIGLDQTLNNTNSLEVIVNRTGISMICWKNAFCNKEEYPVSKSSSDVNGFAFLGFKNNSIESNKLCIQKLSHHEDDQTNGLICSIRISDLKILVTLNSSGTVSKVANATIQNTQDIVRRNRTSLELITLWLSTTTTANTEALENSTTSVEEEVANSVVSLCMIKGLIGKEQEVLVIKSTTMKKFLNTYCYAKINLGFLVCGIIILSVAKCGYNGIIHDYTIAQFYDAFTNIESSESTTTIDLLLIQRLDGSCKIE
jgi:hypothetical protein